MRIQRAVVSLSLGLVGAALAAAPSKALAQDTVAVMTAGGGGLEWSPLIATDGLVLTVAGPGGLVIRRAFPAGQVATFSPFNQAGGYLPDGVYKYELQVAPHVSTAQRQQVEQGRAAAEPQPGPARLGLGGVQSGTFAIRGGSFVVGGQPEARSGSMSTAGTPDEPISAQDQVIPDDLIVQGSACIGLDCVDNESFGFDTIRLKENNTRIKFEDTSASAGFPTVDWQLTANDSASGGLDKFSIEDITDAKVPFTVQGGAPTNSIFVDSSGHLGLRTSTPVLDVHANTSDTPAVRFEQNNSGGFTAQTWDVAGNEANFFVRDVTGGSRLPLRIRPGAPTSSLDISASGNVGVGTASPQANLHVFGAPTADVFVGVGENPASSTALNLGYAGASFGRGAGFFNMRPDVSAVAPNPSLRFLTGNVLRMIIDNEGFMGLGVLNPIHPIELASGAHVTNGGVWTNASSRALKDDIHDLSTEDAMSALQGLNPVRFVYKADDTEKHVGFIAEDVPELLATADRKSLSPMDVVAVLTKVVQEQQKRIAELTARLDALRAEGGR